MSNIYEYMQLKIELKKLITKLLLFDLFWHISVHVSTSTCI